MLAHRKSRPLGGIRRYRPLRWDPFSTALSCDGNVGPSRLPVCEGARFYQACSPGAILAPTVGRCCAK
ncbi:hypothetical protein ALP30_101614 [Pseudomonas syringae pv. primulae]|nr:hypothetical protein ALP30_101614 [Pseudomonas syringae pv. primulae]